MDLKGLGAEPKIIGGFEISKPRGLEISYYKQIHLAILHTISLDARRWPPIYRTPVQQYYYTKNYHQTCNHHKKSPATMRGFHLCSGVTAFPRSGKPTIFWRPSTGALPWWYHFLQRRSRWRCPAWKQGTVRRSSRVRFRP